MKFVCSAPTYLRKRNLDDRGKVKEATGGSRNVEVEKNARDKMDREKEQREGVGRNSRKKAINGIGNGKFFKFIGRTVRHDDFINNIII